MDSIFRGRLPLISSNPSGGLSLYLPSGMISIELTVLPRIRRRSKSRECRSSGPSGMVSCLSFCWWGEHITLIPYFTCIVHYSARTT
jgi:hypothetical protein